MSINPTVSIIIPVFNGSNYLRDAIDSALAQTYQNVEVIVVNDGSNDEGKTDTIAKSYGDKIQYYSKKNGGVAAALNFGINKARGEYMSWLSHDDVYFPNKVEAQISYLNGLKGKDLAKVILYTDYEYIDKDSSYMSTIRTEYIAPNQFVYALIISQPIGGCTTLIPKTCFETMGMFDEGLKSTQDYDMWFRMAKGGIEFIHIPEVLIKSRVHSEQGCAVMGSKHLQEISGYFKMCLHEVAHLDKRRYPLLYNTLSLFYIKAAITLKIRNYPSSSKEAFSLAVKHMFNSNILFILKTSYFMIEFLFRKPRQDFALNPFIRVEQ